MPDQTCEMCSCSDPSILFRCQVCERFFCNAPTGSGSTHVVKHVRLVGHGVFGFPGFGVPQCAQCGVCSIRILWVTPDLQFSCTKHRQVGSIQVLAGDVLRFAPQACQTTQSSDKQQLHALTSGVIASAESCYQPRELPSATAANSSHATACQPAELAQLPFGAQVDDRRGQQLPLVLQADQQAFVKAFSAAAKLKTAGARQVSETERLITARSQRVQRRANERWAATIEQQIQRQIAPFFWQQYGQAFACCASPCAVMPLAGSANSLALCAAAGAKPIQTAQQRAEIMLDQDSGLQTHGDLLIQQAQQAQQVMQQEQQTEAPGSTVGRELEADGAGEAATEKQKRSLEDEVEQLNANMLVIPKRFPGIGCRLRYAKDNSYLERQFAAEIEQGAAYYVQTPQDQAQSADAKTEGLKRFESGKQGYRLVSDDPELQKCITQHEQKRFSYYELVNRALLAEYKTCNLRIENTKETVKSADLLFRTVDGKHFQLIIAWGKFKRLCDLPVRVTTEISMEVSQVNEQTREVSGKVKMVADVLLVRLSADLPQYCVGQEVHITKAEVSGMLTQKPVLWAQQLRQLPESAEERLKYKYFKAAANVNYRLKITPHSAQLKDLQQVISEVSLNKDKIRMLNLLKGCFKGSAEHEIAAMSREQCSEERAADILGNMHQRIAQLRCSNADLARPNEYQLEAVKCCLTRCLTLIQGCPGGGKTYTSALALMCLLDLYPGRQILCCAGSNIAADNLALYALKFDLPVLRVYARSREDTQEASFQGAVLSHSLHVIVQAKIRAGVYVIGSPGDTATKLISESQSAQLLDALAAGASFTTGSVSKQVQHLYMKLEDFELQNTQIIISTCTSAVNERISTRRFAAVLIDETSQMIEPDALLAVRCGPQHVILVGDQKQLGPTLQNSYARAAGLGRSLYERVLQLGVRAVCLNEQYRMHPGLLRFPNEHFYSGQITSQVAPESRLLSQFGGQDAEIFGGTQSAQQQCCTQLQAGFGLSPSPSPGAACACVQPQLAQITRTIQTAQTTQPTQPALPTRSPHPPHPAHSPYSAQLVAFLPPAPPERQGLQRYFTDAFPSFFWHVKEPEIKNETTLSCLNKKEAACVVQLVQRLLAEFGLEKSQIGVITPYSAQQQEISDCLERCDACGDARNGAGRPRDAGLLKDARDAVKVNSVDAFQGSEKDVIVFSCVRSNDLNQIGFLSDEKRVNVAFTRARFAFFIIGDALQLKSQDNIWRDVVQFYAGQGALLRGESVGELSAWAGDGDEEEEGEGEGSKDGVKDGAKNDGKNLGKDEAENQGTDAGTDPSDNKKHSHATQQARSATRNMRPQRQDRISALGRGSVVKPDQSAPAPPSARAAREGPNE